MTKSSSAFLTIGEVSNDLKLPQHVLRFWETKFSLIKPMKRGGGRRYYRPEDVKILRGIQRLLYADGYTIKGVQKLLSEDGKKVLQEATSERKKNKPLHENVEAKQKIKLIINELEEIRAIARR